MPQDERRYAGTSVPQPYMSAITGGLLDFSVVVTCTVF
ncbi:hypothetical protein BZL29_2610 [Mycobacterium kansasii]|uniref:Uncharacterized protein n=1 Tax=Mycobacterium kansasii TaxID=1768 RepID=A0A1V3XP89_MYCKA|nr:hypothetical protein BZL29_2610 [Mycobacterium kansasii]